MVKSAELRWIFPGHFPANLFQIFINSHLLSHQPVREDVYLKFPSSTSVGVKFRESNFEIKPLVESLGNFVITNGVKGVIEIWEKWSCSSTEVQAYFNAAIKEDDWVKVSKERWIRKFVIEPVISEVLADSSPDLGCSVELTEIKIYKKYYWSLAFETFGDFKNPEKALKQASLYFFDKILTKVTFELMGGKVGSFNFDNSCSYPLWLQKAQLT